MNIRKIAIGSDRRGYELKENLKGWLMGKGLEVIDTGVEGPESKKEYPEIALLTASLVSDGTVPRAIIIDGAGIGSQMAANKVPGVRAANLWDEITARNSREHNDANVVTLGSGLISEEQAKRIIDIFLTTDCTADRHIKRVGMITAYERNGKIEENMNFTDNDLRKIVDRVTELMRNVPQTQCSGNVCSSPETARRFLDLGVGRLTNVPGNGNMPNDIAQYIDHTLLKPATTEQELREFCRDATKYPFASVCVNPSNVKLVAEELRDTKIKTCSVVGFPLGANVPEIKALEARRAIRDGASEIDMVINIGALKSGNYDLVLKDIKYVVNACRDGSALCKVIIETSMLTDEEKVKACVLAKEAKADYVKTSTGMGGGGATAHDIALMAEAVGGTKMGVKASGGIRSYADAKKMIEAGATRIGAGAGVQIVREAKGLSVSGEKSSDY